MDEDTTPAEDIVDAHENGVITFEVSVLRMLKELVDAQWHIAATLEELKAVILEQEEDGAWPN